MMDSMQAWNRLQEERQEPAACGVNRSPSRGNKAPGDPSAGLQFGYVCVQKTNNTLLAGFLLGKVLKTVRKENTSRLQEESRRILRKRSKSNENKLGK